VVLDHRRHCEQQFALGDEQVALRLGRDDVAERGPENLRSLLDEA
jgi:hypothetical protein